MEMTRARQAGKGPDSYSGSELKVSLLRVCVSRPVSKAVCQSALGFEALARVPAHPPRGIAAFLPRENPAFPPNCALATRFRRKMDPLHAAWPASGPPATLVACRGPGRVDRSTEDGVRCTLEAERSPSELAKAPRRPGSEAGRRPAGLPCRP